MSYILIDKIKHKNINNIINNNDINIDELFDDLL
jgi:enterochelin esterase-like enzyme